jgi:acetoin utilization protein AcuA
LNVPAPASAALSSSLLPTARGPIALVDHADAAFLAAHPLDPGLGAFIHYARHAAEVQGDALQRVAGLPEGRVLAAVHEGRIVAFLTFHPADKSLRWGRETFPELLELGGIEVSRDYRGLGIARALMALAFGTGDFEDRIVYATGYTWCWDVEGSGLSKAAYRERIVSLFRRFGFDEHVTDEPNIRFDWCNVLMVRVGPGVSLAAHRRFLGGLFERPAPAAAA